MNPKNPVSRRTFLQGLGATIAVPYLEVMGRSTIYAQAGQREPRRLARSTPTLPIGTQADVGPVPYHPAATGLSGDFVQGKHRPDPRTFGIKLLGATK